MSITTNDLNAEREILQKDFEALTARIKQVDVELIQMKSNLNAVHGAIQQIDRLLKKSTENDEDISVEDGMPRDKEKALNIATS